MPTQQMKIAKKGRTLCLKGKNLDDVVVFPLKRFQNRNFHVFQLEGIQLKFLIYTTAHNFRCSNTASLTSGTTVAKEMILIFFMNVAFSGL